RPPLTLSPQGSSGYISTCRHLSSIQIVHVSIKEACHHDVSSGSGVQKPVPRPVPWLWPGRIAAGRLTLIDGDPDQGKSFVTLDLAARLTAGRELPDGSRSSEPLSVLLLSGEDN